MKWRRAEELNLHPFGALVFGTRSRCRWLAPSVGAPPGTRTQTVPILSRLPLPIGLEGR
jgi:hypothetical protein